MPYPVVYSVFERIQQLPESEQNSPEVQIALTLATELEDKPNASVARELLALLRSFDARTAVEPVADGVADLIAEREKRRGA